MTHLFLFYYWLDINKTIEFNLLYKKINYNFNLKKPILMFNLYQ